MINKTPILTNESYKINHIDLDFNLINETKVFKNVEIECNKVNNIENHSIKEFSYGLGNEVLNNNVKYNNDKIVFDTLEKTNMKLTYNFDKENDTLINYVEVNVKNDTHITVVYRSNTKDYNFLNSMLKFNIEDDKVVTIDVINLLNDKSNDLIAIEAILNKDSKATINVIDLGSKNSISNIYINALGDNSVGKVNTIYMGKNKEIKDINYITHLRGKNSVIDMKIEGSLDGESRKSFKGTIDFKKGCFKSKGEESENCIMLSEKAISKALPILLCTEEDVEGAHSASSGKIEEDKIYYIMSRGIDRKEAVKIILKAKFHRIIEKIKDLKLKEEIIKIIERNLD